MKTYKISGINKEVCCVEQKLAYNIAFRCYINHVDDLKSCQTEAQKSQLVMKLRDMYMGYMADTKAKYNPDALFVALNQGLRKYMENHFIASDYKVIGEAFPIPY